MPRSNSDGISLLTRRQQALFDVLRAYALADTTVGYCQGMGFITAVLLLYASSEDVFCLLQRIIQDYEMAGLFQPGFPTLYECFYTHKQLLQLWLPRLSAHFVCLSRRPPIGAVSPPLSLISFACPWLSLMRWLALLCVVKWLSFTLRLLPFMSTVSLFLSVSVHAASEVSRCGLVWLEW